MTLREALRKGTDILKSANIEAPAVDAGVLLCHVIEKDRAYMYTHGEMLLEPAVEEEYMKMIGRRAQGQPVQYITGHQEFMGLEFRVNAYTLIPRADTETLVESVLKHAKELTHISDEIHIMDIGTGSGCIAVSLAHYCPQCRVTAVDVSPGALAVAEENSKRLGTSGRMEFVRSNLFEELHNKPELINRFDVIVSNPPYIRRGDIHELQIEVREYEPMGALDGGWDGLEFYRAIIAGSSAFLKKGGLLAFEVGYDQAADVAGIMQHSFKHIRIEKDLSGIDRVVTGWLNKV